MSYPDPSTLQASELLEATIQQLEVVAPEDAAEVLRDEVRRRALALDSFVSHAPDRAQIAEELSEVDVERVIQLVGTTRTALHLIAAAIVELGTTARAIADTVQWMELRPVGKDGTQQHLGVDVAYILLYRALTREQRWLLHTLAVWSPLPATISREHALTVAVQSGIALDELVTPEDLDHLVALALVDRADLHPEADLATRSPSTYQRIRIDPYVRYIASSGLTTWTIPAKRIDELAHLEPTDIVTATFTNWGVRFAEVIAGPTLPTPNDVQSSDDEATADDDAPTLTPEPALEALTDDEAWVALEPEAPHILLAAAYARELGAAEHIYRLCQLLGPLLRRNGTPPARALLRPLLESGLLAARMVKATNETLLLATQLADLAIDEHEWERAEMLADEALAAALQRKDMRVIGFATRRVAALAVRLRHSAKAMTRAKQAVALARANGDRAELDESITLLAAATKLAEG
ncbi:MAG: hypothetical protein H0X24_05220 [Ktedonobacterales bacterium]|nr:hypothetical protein [Ktedonobacterales bacterium]